MDMVSSSLLLPLSSRSQFYIYAVSGPLGLHILFIKPKNKKHD
jgi:hypothetical protein